MLAALERQVESYNEACNDTCAKLKMSSAGTPLVAICSPLMERTHSLSNSGEMCFMDSSGNMDRENCRVFLLLTHTPVQVVFSWDSDNPEDEKTISEGLELLKSLLKNDAFGGRGDAGPCLFLTDDSKAEKGAIAQVFLLQAVWRCLWNKEHKVEMKDRQTLFSIVKDMLYARETSTVELLYQQALDNPSTASLNEFQRNFRNLKQEVQKIKKDPEVKSQAEDEAGTTSVTITDPSSRTHGHTSTPASPKIKASRDSIAELEQDFFLFKEETNNNLHQLLNLTSVQQLQQLCSAVRHLEEENQELRQELRRVREELTRRDQHGHTLERLLEETRTQLLTIQQQQRVSTRPHSSPTTTTQHQKCVSTQTPAPPQTQLNSSSCDPSVLVSHLTLCFKTAARGQKHEGPESHSAKKNLDSIFKELEHKIISELKSFKRLLSPDYPECSERDRYDDEGHNRVREGLLKITLLILRKMNQTDLAKTLQTSKSSDQQIIACVFIMNLLSLMFLNLTTQSNI
ncbi:hypothetical protein G5714_022019 [Onychostoma macrolepis]|uniref:Uncharacterized protein n=1 Tax=Onychostoma macrolepis TaxID=369639 RepID=A0A7J6BTD1_9TELE|nr:hypothetical protein G5714_022019 [Onychostoma macrolepis]